MSEHEYNPMREKDWWDRRWCKVCDCGGERHWCSPEKGDWCYDCGRMCFKFERNAELYWHYTEEKPFSLIVKEMRSELD